MDSSRTTAGHSIIELTIALAITSLVLAEVFGMFYSQVQIRTAQKRVIDSQEDARLIADMISDDASAAGFLMPGSVAISNIDAGGYDDSDILCVSDLSVLNETNIAAADERFTATSITSNVGAGATSVDVNALEMDVDGDGDDDYDDDAGLIISNGTRSHCARITSVSLNTISFTPATPSGFSMTVTDALVAPAVIYEIDNRILRRNNELLATNVEDLQVEFAIDTNNDNQIGGGEFPINSMDNQAVAQTRGVQISVLTRTSVESEEIEGVGRQTVANHAASGVPDGYRRRLATVTTALRNIP